MKFFLSPMVNNGKVKINNSGLVPGYEIYINDFDEIIRATDLLNKEEAQQLHAYGERKISDSNDIDYAELKNSIKKWAEDFKKEVLNQHEKLPCLRFIMDNSGSFRGTPAFLLFTLIHAISEVLEECEIPFEVLGYTTKKWKGGESRKKWLDEGRAKNPGRLNDLRHVIFKGQNEEYESIKESYSLLMKKGYFKENIDGEAIEWAMKRQDVLKNGSAIIVHLSDGAPVDDSTLSANGGNFLERHLQEVLKKSNLHNIPVYSWGVGRAVGENYPYTGCFSFANMESLTPENILKALSILQAPSLPVDKQVGQILEYDNTQDSIHILQQAGISLEQKYFDILDKISPELVIAILENLQNVSSDPINKEVFEFILDTRIRIIIKDTDGGEDYTFQIGETSEEDLEMTAYKIKSLSRYSIIEKWIVYNENQDEVISLHNFTKKDNFNDIALHGIETLRLLGEYANVGVAVLKNIPQTIPSSTIKMVLISLSRKGNLNEGNISKINWTNIHVATLIIINQERSKILQDFTSFIIDFLDKYEYFNSKTLSRLISQHPTWILRDEIIPFYAFAGTEAIFNENELSLNMLGKISEHVEKENIEKIVKNIVFIRNTPNNIPKHLICSIVVNTNPEVLEFTMSFGVRHQNDFGKLSKSGILNANKLGSSEKREILTDIYARKYQSGDLIPIPWLSKRNIQKGDVDARDHLRIDELDKQFFGVISGGETYYTRRIGRLKDILSEMEELLQLNPRIIKARLNDISQKQILKIDEKEIDKRSQGDRILVYKFLIAGDYCRFLYKCYENNVQDLEEDFYRQAHKCMSEVSIDVNVGMFKDFHQLNLYGKMRKLCIKIEGTLGIVTEKSIQRKGLTDEEVNNTQTIFSKIDIRTCKKEEFDKIYKDLVKRIHPDISRQEEKEKIHLQAMNPARDVVYKLRGWT